MEHAALDFESTGVQAGSRAIELAGVLFDEEGGIDVFQQLINPGMPLPKDAMEVNGITEDMVSGKPNAGIVLSNFFEWLRADHLIAHNAKFDMGIISWEAERFGIKIPEWLTVIDTLDIAKKIGETKNNKLATLADHYGLAEEGESHRALADARMCMNYFNLMRNRSERLNIGYWEMSDNYYKYTNNFPDNLSMLPELVEKGRPLSFTYVDAKNNETERTITPYGWALQKNQSSLMFHGMCHMRKERRTFISDRVRSVTSTEAEVNSA